MVIAYDLIQAVLFAGLAGAMFTVSGTAFSAIFDVPAPELTDKVPNNGWFVLIVIVCGLVTTVLAAVGFTVVAVFGEIMTPVLFAGIVYLCVQSLRMLGISDECGLWCIISDKVYTGEVVSGQTKFGLAHCVSAGCSYVHVKALNSGFLTTSCRYFFRGFVICNCTLAKMT